MCLDGSRACVGGVTVACLYYTPKTEYLKIRACVAAC